MIRSLPKHIVDQYTRGNVEFNEQSKVKSGLKRGTPHLIFKKTKIMDSKSNAAFGMSSFTSISSSKSQKTMNSHPFFNPFNEIEKIKAQVESELKKNRAKRVAPAVVYPEVLVVFDYSEFK